LFLKYPNSVKEKASECSVMNKEGRNQWCLWYSKPWPCVHKAFRIRIKI